MALAGGQWPPCPSCNGRGVEWVTECPLGLVTAAIWDVLELVELYHKGLPPVAGGSLDQASAFIAAARLVWHEQEFWRSTLGLKE